MRRQRGRRDVEARMHGARHLVHVLTTRPLGPDGAELDFRWIDSSHWR